MSSNRKADNTLPDDLERNPGIGQSKGSFMTGQRPADLEGESTVEGDVESDSTATGGVPQQDRERTNK